MHSAFDDAINRLISDVIYEQHLQSSNIIFKENKIKNSSTKREPKSISLVEMAYPNDPKKNDAVVATKSILRVEYKKDSISLIIPNSQYRKITSGKNYNLDVKDKSTDYVEVIVIESSDEIMSFIKDNILTSLRFYSSSNTFSCCGRYLECSDNKRCMHENNLYAKGCYYRKNLESGKIFYGKNKTIHDQVSDY